MDVEYTLEFKVKLEGQEHAIKFGNDGVKMDAESSVRWLELDLKNIVRSYRRLLGKGVKKLNLVDG